jgi:endonuclease/exonuclease/phosphatase family metal-dependent hydrolase
VPLHRWRIGGPPGVAAALGASLLIACAAAPAHALRVVTWNLLQYPTSSLAARQPHFRTVMSSINADILFAQELNSAAGRDSFLNNVLNVVQPGEWTATSWLNLGGEGGAVFYKPAKVTVSGLSQIATSGPRDVLVCLVKPAGYVATAASTRLYSIHLKAGGPDTPDSTTRRLESTDIRNILNLVPAGTNLLLGGDSNFYGALEGGYIRLTESQLDNDGRLKDPLTMPGTWHINSGYAVQHTQSPCALAVGCVGSNGGMDDRFDLWLTSFGMQDDEGLDYLPVSPVFGAFAYPYQYGNDGQHFNTDVNGGGFNNSVGITVANALWSASDHLPVVITIQVPARVVAGSELNFGSAILGGAPTQNLPVSNGGAAPADELTYSLSAPSGFSAPGGTFSANAGGAANNHSLGMSTGSVGVKTGTLTVNTDDPDSTAKAVLLSGTVLDHAAASLDSSAVQVASTVDFGDHAIGQFADRPVRVHDFDYDALQARLSVNAANFVGGDGRFSIVGGFSSALLAGTGQTWNIHFDDFGANLDQEYTATLTFSGADEALPGAAAAADLVVTLRAKPISGVTGVPGRDLPKVLAFYPPHPNPFTREALFAYDLPAAAPVSLAIYDLSGRRVASLVSGSQEPDRYQVRWNAVSEGGARVPAGLYFARFTTPGLSRVSRLIVLP